MIILALENGASQRILKAGVWRYLVPVCRFSKLTTKRYLVGGRASVLSSERTLLVCGDGDLSFSSSVSKKLAEEGVHLTATVLETKENHRQVYSDSRDNARAIESFGHDVRYDTDATKLPEIFETKFDRVQFNFPHWRGKANIRYNRLLMKDFFRSASQVIDPSNGGSIDVALMKPQGGIAAKTMTEWKQSWMPAVYAAYADLLLVSARPFLPSYQLSSYRFTDKHFYLKEPLLFSFSASANCVAPRDLELYCHFEVYLDSDIDVSLALEDFVNDQVQPLGWRAEVYFRKWLRERARCYKIIFFGSKKAITKEAGEEVRLWLTGKLQAHGFPYMERGTWSISNPCPSSTLPAYFKVVGMESESVETR